jgi:hypothetical protein
VILEDAQVELDEPSIAQDPVALPCCAMQCQESTTCGVLGCAL